MSLPYFPMYPTDFEADTSHLTLAEDGAYNRLLRLMWMTPGCSLPDDDAWIKRRMRCTDDEFETVVRIVIDEFCERKNRRVSNARLAKVFSQSEEAHKKRVAAGSKGGKSKAPKTNDKVSSNAKAKPKQPEPEPEPEPDTKKEAKASLEKKRGNRLADDWFLPKEWGEWAVDEGYEYDQIKVEAEKFKDYWHGIAGAKGVKLDWQATWRNWMRNTSQQKGGSNGNRTNNNGRSKSDAAAREIAFAARAIRTPSSDCF